MEHLVFHEWKTIYTLKWFETIKIEHFRRQSNRAAMNHVGLGKDMLVVYET